MGVRIPRHLEEELAWAIDKWLWVISHIMLFSYITKELKNKVILSLNNIVCIAMWSLVMYSICFII